MLAHIMPGNYGWGLIMSATVVFWGIRYLPSIVPDEYKTLTRAGLVVIGGVGLLAELFV